MRVIEWRIDIVIKKATWMPASRYPVSFCMVRSRELEP